jgi:hypothetical protein
MFTRIAMLRGVTFEKFRRLCLTLPEAEERETWGEATFRVRDRIFAMGSQDGGYVSVKASLDDQAGLLAMDPKTFAPSAYTGRFGWVQIRLRGIGPELAERVITNAWKRTAPKRLVAQLSLPLQGEGREGVDPSRLSRRGQKARRR